MQLLDKEREELLLLKRTSQIEVQKAKCIIAAKDVELENLKMKLGAMRMRKNMSLDAKFCLNCGKEFSERENFKWSCRVHKQAEYDTNTQMWWCCGKTDYDAPGCLTKKHTTQEEKATDQDEDEDAAKHVRTKCMCCKEYAGHREKECPKDPNYRSTFDILDEDDRIENWKESKTLFADSAILSLKMLKELLRQKQAHAKRKGLLSFDDFQYRSFNTSVLDLNQEPKPKAKDEFDSSYDSESSSYESEGGKDQAKPSKEQLAPARLFSNDEVLDIEEAQDKNGFCDLQDQLEDNYLAIEDNIKAA